jgi:hypothetical protein
MRTPVTRAPVTRRPRGSQRGRGREREQVEQRLSDPQSGSLRDKEGQLAIIVLI